MTFMKTFDFSDLSTIEINAEMEGFQPRFDNPLALTAYRQQTLILTREGQAVILNCRLQECLSRFRKENASVGMNYPLIIPWPAVRPRQLFRGITGWFLLMAPATVKSSITWPTT